MLRNSLIREMSFKANFVLWMVVEVLWFCGQIVFFSIIFGQVDRIGDWSKWEVVLLVGTHQMIAQLFQAFFFVNVANIPELVRTGKLDLLLARATRHRSKSDVGLALSRRAPLRSRRALLDHAQPCRRQFLDRPCPGFGLRLFQFSQYRALSRRHLSAPLSLRLRVIACFLAFRLAPLLERELIRWTFSVAPSLCRGVRKNS